ncbi:MAG: methylenetetrahydrofolate reductase C-terminal domain-containing protein [Candidatus Omnitrophota bacterium]
MIITRQKPLDEILDFIKNDRNIFLVGCAVCATTCKTGGEEQIKTVSENIRKAGKTVVGWAVLEPACSRLEIKKFRRKEQGRVDKADAILSLACGGGTQAVNALFEDKNVYPMNDTLFQGEMTEVTVKKARFEQKCSLCGECMLQVTGAICPVTRCPKSLVNGPCGGVKKGKCEIDTEMDCTWTLIYKRLKGLDRLGELKKVRAPRDHSKDKRPRTLLVQ